MSMKKVIALITCNGAGKTETILWNVVAFGLGLHPLQIASELFKPPLKIRLMAGTFKEGIQDRLLPRIRNFLPKQYILDDYNDNRRRITLRPELAWDGEPVLRDERGIIIGGFFQFMTYDSLVSQHAGGELDIIAGDEEPPYTHFMENKARLRMGKNGGRFLIGMTPELESERPMTWSYDKLVQSNSKNVETIGASVYDCPWLPAEYIKDLEETCDETEFAVKGLGQYAQLQGLVYKKFRNEYFPDGNKIEAYWPKPNAYIAFAADIHESKPFAGVWIEKDETNNLKIFNELKRSETEGKTIKEVCDIMRQKEAGLNIAYRLMGQGSFRKTDVRSGYDMMVDFNKHDMYFDIWPERDIISRINAMRQYIRGTYGPKLFVSETCVDFIYDITHLTYRKMGSRSIEQKVVIRDKGKCLPDCASFICEKEGLQVGYEGQKEEKPIWMPPRPSRIYQHPTQRTEHWDALELERIRAQMRN